MKFWAPQPRQPLIGLAVAAMFGIFVADRWHLPPPWVFGAPVAALLVLLWRPATVTCGLFCAALAFELHTLRYWESDAPALAGTLAHGRLAVDATGIVWSEPEKPATYSGHVSCHFILKLETIGRALRGEPLPCSALVNVRWSGPIPAYGDRVMVSASAENLRPARNPGEFDFTRYQQRHGVYSELSALYAMNCRVLSHGHGNPVRALGFRAHRWMQNKLEIDLADSQEIKETINGVVLGLSGDSPEDLKTLLQRTGTIHLFVVSGLNIAMLATIAFFILRPFGLPRSLLLVLVIAILAAYTLVTGLRTSSVRSTIMATLVLAAMIFDRRALSFNGLAAAALVILLADTNELFSAGFQFSFTVLFIIIAFAERIQRKIESLAQPDPFLPPALWSWQVKTATWWWHRLCASFGVILASWIGSLIFTAGYFHLFSPGSIVANFLAVPFAFVVLSLGIASLLTAKLSLHAVVLFNNANWFVAKAMLWVLHASAHLPGGFVYLENPRFSRPPPCEVTVLDLGEGGAVHLRGGGADWLFDTGNDLHYRQAVLPYLRSRGVNRLDGLLLSYGGVQRLGGAVTALEDFRPRLVADSTQQEKSPKRKELHSALVQRHLGKGLYARGDFIHLGRTATVRVLYPPAGLKRNSGADLALVLQLECGGTRALFMSDSGFFTEQWLLDNEPDLRSDIVVKGQRAKDFSGTANFLQRVAPRVVICSALGYGEPVETLDAWEADTRAQGIQVFRQDQSGAVQIAIRGDSFELRGFVNDQTFRSRAR